jgi:hypothetical protein
MDRSGIAGLWSRMFDEAIDKPSQDSASLVKTGRNSLSQCGHLAFVSSASGSESKRNCFKHSGFVHFTVTFTPCVYSLSGDAFMSPSCSFYIPKDQGDRAGGPTRVIVEKPKNVNEGNGAEKPKG